MNRTNRAPPGSKSESTPSWFPAWVTTLGTPVWISSPDGNLSYINARAEVLLGVRAEECLNQPCHRVISGEDDSGESLCRPQCRFRSLAESGKEIEPVLFQTCGKWLQVIAIPVHAPDGSGPWLVHLCVDANLAHRLQAYMIRVADRGRDGSEPVCLTPRETEILQRLTHDETPQAISDALQVSYATVRNHIQHILAKLGVHSIAEAIAVHLLRNE